MKAAHSTIGSGEPLDFAAMRSIAVFRALQLGDLLCAVPALRALRRAAPQAHIALIGLPWAASFAERFSEYVDEHLPFPGFPGLPETTPEFDRIPDFFISAQNREFDLAIQMHGSGALTNPITVAFGAKRNAGFYVPGEDCPDPRYFAPWSETEHEVLRYLRLLNFLGIESQGEALEFPLHDADYRSLQAAGIAPPPAGSYVCIHPGARLPSRRWSSHRFAQVADGLAAQGLKIVLTGSEQERDITNAVLRAMHVPATDMTGHTDLGALAALVAHARMVVCNDTGISHIAAAVATPSVVVCSGADPIRWAPLDRGRHRLQHVDIPCRPCAYLVCPIGHPCAESISAEQVLAEAINLYTDGMPHQTTVDDQAPVLSSPSRLHAMSNSVQRRPYS
ncbi:MAG: ADP-heptose--LPS heptosyltransferase [Burkholderiales bacterium RIFCSPLOWO2_02_FULL_57_36]|nr:MAG: ADP-heptose--LPS heptosyltransferase [Burkholderiales bacterium RIFCSPLOWO2_02_FULL_57_36]